jgi:hypothetical protein
MIAQVMLFGQRHLEIQNLIMFIAYALIYQTMSISLVNMSLPPSLSEQLH